MVTITRDEDLKAVSDFDPADDPAVSANDRHVDVRDTADTGASTSHTEDVLSVITRNNINTTSSGVFVTPTPCKR